MSNANKNMNVMKDCMNGAGTDFCKLIFIKT